MRTCLRIVAALNIASCLLNAVIGGDRADDIQMAGLWALLWFYAEEAWRRAAR